MPSPAALAFSARDDHAGGEERTAEYVRTVLEPIVSELCRGNAAPSRVVAQRDQLGELDPGGATGPELPHAMWYHVAAKLFPGRSPHVLAAAAAAKKAPVTLLFSSLRDVRDFQREQGAAGPPRSVYLPLPVRPIAKARGGGGAVLLARPNVEDHAHVVLAAWRMLGAEAPALRWVTADRDLPACRRILQRAEHPAVELSGGRLLEAAPDLVDGADLVFLLLHSAVDALGPELPIALASGVPVVVLDYAECSMLPDACVAKILPGASEAAAVAALVRRLFCGSRAADARAELGACGRAYAFEMHAPEVIAAELMRLVGGRPVWKDSL